jgi:ABC-type Fe3+-hydroxamate transport system substrate-binding protein
MSEFEAVCLNWYFDTVNDFSMSAGIVAESFRELGLVGKAKAYFLKAQELINRSQVKVARERAKMEQKETSGTDNA